MFLFLLSWFFLIVWEITNITNFVFVLQSKKLSEKVTKSLKLLSCSRWAYIGVLVQSPLPKCLRNDFLIFYSLGYRNPTCVCILSLLDSTSMLNTSTTGSSIVCMYFVFYWKSILLQKTLLYWEYQPCCFYLIVYLRYDMYSKFLKYWVANIC